MKKIIITLIFLSLSPMLLGVSFGILIGDLFTSLIDKKQFKPNWKEFFWIKEIKRLWK